MLPIHRNACTRNSHAATGRRPVRRRTIGRVHLWTNRAVAPNPLSGWRSLGFVGAAIVAISAMLPVGVGGQETDKLPAPAVARLGQFGEGAGYVGVYRTVVSPDGKLLATRASDQIVRVWEIESGKKLCELDGHEGRVTGLAFTPDGKQVITSSPGEREVKIVWDARTGEQVRKISGGARLLRFLKDGEVLRSIDDRKFGSFELASGRQITEGTWLLQQSDVPLAMSHDGQRMATYNHLARRQGQIRINVRALDASSQSDAVALTGIAADPVSGKFSSDGRYFAASCRGQNHVLLWRLDQPDRNRSLTGHTQQIQEIAFSHDGRLLATASWDATVRIWEVLTARPITSLEGHGEHVCAVQFSPDDRFLASGASGRTDNSTIVWDSRRAVLGPDATEKPTAEALAGFLKQLSSSDPQQAFTAIGNLIKVPDQALELFQKEVDTVTKAVDQENLKRLIRDLDDDQFDVRESAHKKLLRLRAVADVLLRQALKNSPSAEVEYRITRILETPLTEAPLAEDEMFRLHRMIFALELIANEGAQRQLATLSTGHPNVTIMRDAGATLQRLKEARGA